MQTKAIKKLEEQLEELTPGTVRYETVAAAKSFKHSWIKLGQMLWTVYKEKQFRGWGYLTFEAYCIKEVGVRPNTAKKLLNSYYFLEKEEPTALRRFDQAIPQAVPSADSVNALRLLHKKADALPEDRYDAVREQVLEKGVEAPAVRREIRMLQEGLQTKPPQEARADRRERMIRRAIGTVKALRLELETDSLVNQRVTDSFDALVKRLQEALNT